MASSTPLPLRLPSSPSPATGHNFDVVIPELLESGIRVMVYAGNKDIICNVEGNRRWVDALPWEGSAKWATAKAETWQVEGARAGSVRAVENLSFVEVFDAGHMVRGCCSASIHAAT